MVACDLCECSERLRAISDENEAGVLPKPTAATADLHEQLLAWFTCSGASCP